MGSEAKVMVLGAGMVGHVMALDLAPHFQVVVLDHDTGRLKPLEARGLSTQVVDFKQTQALKTAVTEADVVVGAVPGYLGFETLKAVLETGTPVVDISFFPENASELHALAVENQTTALVDFGVAPGMDNLILGYWSQRANIEKFECLVGGLPRQRNLPYEYKAPFSPIDVIEEYTRPARFRRLGQEIVKEALSEPEMHHFEKVGHLEAFLTDGLRSLLSSYPQIPNMVEKTLRYPGHRAKMETLRDGGFFNNQPIKVGNQEIIPLEATAALLLKQWELGPQEEEFTVMRVSVAGQKANQAWKTVYDLYDERDSKTGFSSMARTTGFTCAAGVHLFLSKRFTDYGVFPPEKVGEKTGCFEFVLEYLAERGVHYQLSETVAG
ncbi:MAG: saccharopine dehydrogenase family protein [Salibacteraceae bacterium]